MNSLGSEREKRALEIFDILVKIYPEAKPLLNYRNAYELLVATMLAAQCTDQRVNTVTPELFEKYPDPHSMFCAQVKDIEEIIRSTGFFRNKTRSLKKLSFALIERYQGKLPESIDELTELPGVGRKTANVIAGYCFDKPAIVVDTHFKRVVGRLELTKETNPDKIEKDIRSFFPEQRQTQFSGALNYHGRYCCKARKPECYHCPIERLCPYPDKELAT
jgi:endonuclease-3